MNRLLAAPILIALLAVTALAVRLGEPALPKCPHGHVAHERCRP